MSLHLFEKYGVELEYIIVDAETLDVKPICDQVLQKVAGAPVSEVEMGKLAWSNELVLHVIELKTNGPLANLAELPGLFQQDVNRINKILAEFDACLLPTGMHPWMDPFKETKLWPHEYNDIYRKYDEIFGCQGHGWSNLQSTHLNLPFSGDEEFGRLHAAIRLVLPILPALAASSPFVDGRLTGFLDSRLEVYRQNQRKIPEIAGKIIPEQVYSAADYEREILQKSYSAIEPFDAEGILQNEWLNSRGAIPRFTRGSIEIRILDIQECPLVDSAIISAIVELLKALVSEKWTTVEAQQAWPVDPLSDIFLSTIKDAGDTVIDNAEYLRIFDFPAGRCQARELWLYLADTLLPAMKRPAQRLRTVLLSVIKTGSLARRIQKAAGDAPGREALKEVYAGLARCLQKGEIFVDL
jgi:gamma-glutamyl:cysteine ligase YbdK (ATP-grasp superfamily)